MHYNNYGMHQKTIINKEWNLLYLMEKKISIWILLLIFMKMKEDNKFKTSLKNLHNIHFLNRGLKLLVCILKLIKATIMISHMNM